MKTNRIGVVHALAFCFNCDWNEGMKFNGSKDPVQSLKALIKKHVENHGHSVTLETGTITHFKPDS